MDRTKEPGGIGEPLFLDVVAALYEGQAAGSSRFAKQPIVIGGRYGLGSHEFTPAMVKAVFDELNQARPKPHFTVGINDDVTKWSLPVSDDFDIEPDDVFRAVFFGLGADGTVGANKNSIKIIGEETDFNTQGYFVYDSKKSGAITISHLRFGPRPIRSAYLIRQANFVACHQFQFLEKFDIVGHAKEGGVLLLNAPFELDAVWAHLPREVQKQIVEKKLRVYVIDALRTAREVGMGGRINTVMQTCFFAISGVLPRDQAIAKIKKAIEKTYAKKGPEMVRKNFAAVDGALAHRTRIGDPGRWRDRPAASPDRAHRSARFREKRDGDDPGRAGRSSSGQRVAGGSGPGRSARRAGRSATSRRISRCGSGNCAFNATSAPLPARTRRSAPRCSRRKAWPGRPKDLHRWTTTRPICAA